MAESLRTISPKEVKEFADNAQSFRGSTLWTQIQCVVYQKGECPDQSLKDPNCGKCDIAKTDQTTMIADITARGFQHKSGPEKLFYSDRVMSTELSMDNGTLSIDHNAGSVKLEYRP